MVIMSSKLHAMAEVASDALRENRGQLRELAEVMFEVAV